MKRWILMGVVVASALVMGLGAAFGIVGQPWALSTMGSEANSMPRAPDDTVEAGTKHPTIVNIPTSLGLVRTQHDDFQGRETGVQCSFCHDDRTRPTPTNPADQVAELREFHTELSLAHGELTCSSCHHPQERDFLRLANGRTVPFSDTMALCAQCHGPVYRSWKHGAHGGMRGYWDLSRGPRERNHCVACHDPHAPAYPQVMPAPPPRDRFYNLQH